MVSDKNTITAFSESNRNKREHLRKREEGGGEMKKKEGSWGQGMDACSSFSVTVNQLRPEI